MPELCKSLPAWDCCITLSVRALLYSPTVAVASTIRCARNVGFSLALGANCEEMRCNRPQAISLVLVLYGRAQAASNQQNKLYNEIVQRARIREHNTCDTFRILELRSFCTHVILETVSLVGVILRTLTMRHSSLRVHLHLFLSLPQASHVNIL